MNREELDTLWHKAMRQSIKEGEDFIRYHFAALVAAHEREACAKVCEDHANSPGVDEMAYRALREADEAIRARGET